MKPAIALVVILLLNSCVQKDKQQPSAPVSASRDSIDKPDSTPKDQNPDVKGQTPQRVFAEGEWKRYEDSLRSEILKRKENKIVKESFLQEMYIRDVASVSKDSVLVTIPFNLHGQDCGARDDYSTDISFGLRLGSKLLFPQMLPFHEHEHGNVEKEIDFTDNFQLIDQTSKHVIYHAVKNKRTLVLFNAPHYGTYAFYFTGVGKNRINGTNVYRIIDEYNRILERQDYEKLETALFPFTSWELTTSEYQNFLN